MASGVKLGRRPGPGKSKLDQYVDDVKALLTNGATKVWVAKKYNTTVQNLPIWLKRNHIVFMLSVMLRVFKNIFFRP